MHLHEFLEEVHAIVKPKVYLEVGVQTGRSLNLAKAAQLAVGVDPYPLVTPCCNQQVWAMDSDTYFSPVMSHPVPNDINFGFIDGLHHAEQALKDFLNITDHLSDSGIVIFDDVLPRNHAEASRAQCPGDWTGDVWKAAVWLYARTELEAMYVNTQPTGVLVVTGCTNRVLEMARKNLDWLTKQWSVDIDVPDEILNRQWAWEPNSALEELRSMPWS